MHNLNNDIPYETLKVIHHEDGYLGELSKNKAIDTAGRQDMDLILTNEKTNPPTCIIQDYGKYMYSLKKNTKKQKNPSVKEIKFRPTTDDHDLGIKAKKAQKFINDGNIVKIKVVMAGRENSHREVADETFDKFLEMLNNYSVDVDKSASGNFITMQVKGSQK